MFVHNMGLAYYNKQATSCALSFCCCYDFNQAQVPTCHLHRTHGFYSSTISCIAIIMNIFDAQANAWVCSFPNLPLSRMTIDQMASYRFALSFIPQRTSQRIVYTGLTDTNTLCLIKPGSQYDTGATSVMSITEKSNFFTSKIACLMLIFRQSD